MISDNLQEISERYKNIVWEGKTWNEVGEGWVDLVYRTMDDIYSVSNGEKVTIHQVKEKFGYLNIYFECEDKDLQSKIGMIVRRASERSKTLCEQCGAPGTHRKEGHRWLTCCYSCGKLEGSDD